MTDEAAIAGAATDGANFTLKEEIRAYWSDRAAGFDGSVSHRISDSHGMPEWQRLIRLACELPADGSLKGWRALDIACGTGEISRVLTGLQADVTAVDFSEAMLGRARTKLAGARWRGLLQDAEALRLLDDADFDLAVTRHLAWTLTDPAAAYAEWRRVLKPGGRLIVVDGDWSAGTRWIDRLKRRVADLLDPPQPRLDRDRHDRIKARLHYTHGLTRRELQRDLFRAGFTTFAELPVGRLYGRGMGEATLPQRLRQTAAHRFALAAR